MKVTIISCVYPPEPVVSAQTSAQLAQALSQAGHQVTVITGFPNRPGGRLYPGYKRYLYKRETQLEVKLIRCWGVYSRQSGLANRFLENITFGITSAFALAFTPRVDVIYANTWPLFAAAFITFVAVLRRIPVVVSIQDIYPESLQAQNRFKAGSWFLRVLRELDVWISHKSQAVVVLSERFAKIYREDRKLPDDHIHIIPNWGDDITSLITGDQRGIRSMHPFKTDDFIFGYGGNISVAAGVEVIILAMQEMGEKETIKLLIAGEGSRLSACKQLAEQGCNPNIVFYSPWPIDETSMVLSAIDVLILPTHGAQSTVSVPSKLINYMLSGRPVLALANDDSDIAVTIRQAGCGWVIPPGQPVLLSRQMIYISHEPKEQLITYGYSGRKYALEHFNKNINLQLLMDLILNVPKSLTVN